MEQEIQDMTQISVPPQQTLAKSGLSEPAQQHFNKVVAEYAGELLRRTVLLASADKTNQTDGTEVITKHVRDAAYDLASSPTERPTSPWSIAGQVLEYVLTAASGVGAGHLDKQAGQITFGVCLAVATILLVTRLSRNGK